METSNEEESDSQQQVLLDSLLRLKLILKFRNFHFDGKNQPHEEIHSLHDLIQNKEIISRKNELEYYMKNFPILKK